METLLRIKRLGPAVDVVVVGVEGIARVLGVRRRWRPAIVVVFGVHRAALRRRLSSRLNSRNQTEATTLLSAQLMLDQQSYDRWHGVLPYRRALNDKNGARPIVGPCALPQPCTGQSPSNLAVSG